MRPRLDSLAIQLAEQPRMTRRTSVKIAGAAALAASPLAALARRPAPARGQSDPCFECNKDVQQRTPSRRGKKCIRDHLAGSFVFTPSAGMLAGCIVVTMAQSYAALYRCATGPCKPSPPPGPGGEVPYSPGPPGADGCPPGTGLCGHDPSTGGGVCCATGSVCCGCIHPDLFIQCCVVEVGCTCCPQS